MSKIASFRSRVLSRIVPILAFALALAPALGTAASPAPEAAPVVYASGSLVIGTQGEVVEVELAEGVLRDGARDALAAVIRQWQFEPVVEDGQPVRARTGMDLRLAVESIEGGVGLVVESVSFGTLKPVSAPPPRFPVEALRERASANVYLLLTVAADGSVAEVQPYLVELLGGRRSDRQRDALAALFSRASMEAAAQWRYVAAGLPEDPAGRQYVVPLRFFIDGARGPVASRVLYPTRLPDGVSAEQVEQRLASASPGSRNALPLHVPVRLRASVEGERVL